MLFDVLIYDGYLRFRLLFLLIFIIACLCCKVTPNNCVSGVSLQEVDHFKFLQRALGAMGYEGFFFPKPSSPCLGIKGNNGPDGCAMFFRTERFELIQTVTKNIDIWKVQSNQV